MSKSEYKTKMEQMVADISATGIKVALARMPIAMGDSAPSTPFGGDPDLKARNLNIKGFNEALNEIIDAVSGDGDPTNDISVVPPEFYALFNQIVEQPYVHRYGNEYWDNLHPNGIGYQSMADHWLQCLVP